MKNYVSKTFYLVLTVAGALCLLHFLPVLTIDGHKLRKVDLLGDIRLDEKDTEPADSLLLLPPVKPAFIDTCKTGMTCIEDYSDSTRRGMQSFFEKLGMIDRSDRPVRIAVFGDSFIEADIFTADLRDMLQSRFGGCGAGFVPITSLTNGYRPTIRQTFAGWSSHASTDSTYFDRSKQGISGHYFIPRPGAYLELKGQTSYASHLDTCEVSSLYFLSQGTVEIRSLVNGSLSETYTPGGGGDWRSVKSEARIGKVRWEIMQADSALFYGASMDGRKGISVDNFSMRGSSGLNLRSIPQKTLARFNDLRPYDLIILQYGLNVATERGKNYDTYKSGMLKVIAHLKTCFPQASILILGVGDRDYRTDTGDLKTMPGVKNLIRYQQALAAEAHVAFWNLFEAMGGEGSMARLVHAKPSLANYDYTHINFRGGKHLAGLLYETLVYGKEQYDRRKKYEKK